MGHPQCAQHRSSLPANGNSFSECSLNPHHPCMTQRLPNYRHFKTQWSPTPPEWVNKSCFFLPKFAPPSALLSATTVYPLQLHRCDAQNRPPDFSPLPTKGTSTTPPGTSRNSPLAQLSLQVKRLSYFSPGDMSFGSQPVHSLVLMACSFPPPLFSAHPRTALHLARLPQRLKPSPLSAV